MTIASETDFEGMKRASEAVAYTLKKMIEYVQPGITTRELDNYGGKLLQEVGARSAPHLIYKFPGHTCISLNEEICHGIPSQKVIQQGDLINIDVSAELGGFFADNGASMVVGSDIHGRQALVDASKAILKKAIYSIRNGSRISDMGALIEKEAKLAGFKVIKNLGGHGLGRSLHEKPDALLNTRDRFDTRRFKKNCVVAIETFITTHSNWAMELADGFTMVGDQGGMAVQHEHTIIITDHEPIILTASNGIWD